jgi:hypothetical protein
MSRRGSSWGCDGVDAADTHGREHGDDHQRLDICDVARADSHPRRGTPRHL